MSRTDPQFKLRMPPALRAQVEQAAEQANRSLNAEIVTRLQASFPQVKPEVSANEKPEPVPAPTPRRQLRLLCLLAKPQLDTAQGAYLPIHTMHRLPPRAMVRGQWSQPRYAGLYLRETQARQPSAAVLARCERHRQTHALRAPARTVRAGGVTA
ncbi:Arc family DNA-binding protein [Ectopseudomonas mendocina]|uniref:Arc family DNA-binding protein n=1 Tax=Ectopseudomonas mendocina TaxID=300 RepID=A0ABD7RQW2_ECTME|nr:Arc family DNA-binding protein [Pseudomonas mendocina]TRO14745.1 Arc family DNA-binding protein [Pseudomonas mendocina]